MKTRLCILSVAVLAALVPVAATAGNPVLEPTTVAVARAEKGQPAQAAFLFDVSSLPRGAGRVIDEALLEWEAPEASSKGLTEFFAYAVTQSWTAVGVEAGKAPAYEENEIAHWTIDPPDYEKHRGFVRLDLTPLVRAWVDGSEVNRGIVVVCPTMTAGQLRDRLGSARLTVRCGYRLTAE